MTAPLFDDDPVRDAEVAAEQYTRWRHHVGRQVAEHREHVVAVATARLSGVDSREAEKALDRYIAAYGPEDVVLLLDMLEVLMWDGVRSAEREARTRLMALRDANDVTPILEVLR